MNKHEFESLASNIIANTIKLKKGELTQDQFLQMIKLTFDEALFEKVERILNENN